MSSQKPVPGTAKRRKLDPRRDQQTGPKSAILESHLNLLNQGKFSDVTFIVGEGRERIPCHQLFLKASSAVFEVMFSERWNQETEKEVLLPDVQPKVFKMFLQFIYAEIFEPNVPEALELLQLANKYDVQLLVSKCEELLESQVTLDHAVQVFQAARIYEKVHLTGKAGDLLTKSLSELATHPSFSQLDKETLMYILKRHDLEMKEVDVFRLALQWARNQKDATVKDSLEDVLPFIRFPIMTLNEFTTAVVPTEILPLPTVVEIYKYFGSDDEAKKSLAGTLGFCTYQRQRIPDVYVPLYPEEIFNDEKVPWYQLRTFKESLQFCVQMPGCPVGPQQPILGFRLSLIELYCPASAPTTALYTTGLPRFKFCLQSKDCRDGDLDFYSSASYKTLDSLKSFDFEQGEGEYVYLKLDTVIALNPNTIYCMTIEGVNSGPITSAAGSVQGQNDTGLMNTVDVNFESIGRTTLTVRRNQLQGFTQDAGPRAIYGLHFKEL